MDACCAGGAPVRAEYTAQGKFVPMGACDKVYVTGQGNRAVIGVLDIFGFNGDSPQCLQFFDRLAEAAGVVVAAPDVFRGKPWSLDRFPPKPEDNLMGWIKSITWEAVKADMDGVAAALRETHGVTRFGTVGFCWGASMSLRAVSDPTEYAAAALLHPTLFGEDAQLAAAARGPLLVVSTLNDPLESVRDVMKATEWGTACKYKRYNDMVHGFCAARGDFQDPAVAAAVGEVIAMTAEFFKANL